jgi:hypothetical protein
VAREIDIVVPLRCFRTGEWVSLGNQPPETAWIRRPHDIEISNSGSGGSSNTWI